MSRWCRLFAIFIIIQLDVILSFSVRDSRLLSPSVRLDFPALVHRPDCVYLDSAASAQKPAAVLDAMTEFYTTSYGNVHRGQGVFCDRATEQYELARSRVARFFGASSAREVVFTGGATTALNLIALSLDEYVVPGDEIVVTIMDHHSNILPWTALARRRGLRVKVAGIGEDYRLDMEALEREITKKTKVVCVPHISNVLGVANPIDAIVDMSRRVGALVVLDACQSAPERSIDVRALGADFVVASGHKMCGPTGVGVLYGRLGLLEGLQPGILGGGMVDRLTAEVPRPVLGNAGDDVTNMDLIDIEPSFLPAPHRFEAGTPPIAEAVGLAAACDYLDGVHRYAQSDTELSSTQDRSGGVIDDHRSSMRAISTHVAELSAYMYEGLRASVQGVQLHGPRNREICDAHNSEYVGPRDSGIVSFHVPGVHSLDLATRLASPPPGGAAAAGARRSVSVRSGHHCASLLHRALKCPEEQGGSLRASVYIYNDKSDVDYFVDAVNRAVHELKSM